MIWIAILRRAAPFLVLVVLALATWWWHTSAVDDAYERGKQEVLARWMAADKLAEQVGQDRTKMLARNALIAEERTIEKVKRLESTLRLRSAYVAGLRVALDERSATPPSGDTAPASCERYERNWRRCDGLLGEAVSLARESEELLKRGQVVLEALQDWSRVVESAK